MVAFASPAEARRVALVVGNADYTVGPLQNPVRDATAVAETFEKQLGFDKVILKKNLGAQAFRMALIEIARESTGAEIGVIYFAGHGTETGGRNFLIPTDARLARASDLDLEAVALDTVLGQLPGVTSLKLVILDACRNDPFPLGGAKRSTGLGLARIEPEGNTLVAYAAKDGTTADDGPGGRHSPFTQALLKYLATPGLEIRQLFGQVRDDVALATSDQQQPYLYGSLGGRGFFLQAPAPAAPVAVAPAPTPALPAPAAAPQLTEVERAWALVKDTPSIPVLEAFRRQYGAANALYDRLAEARIEALARQPSAPASPPTEGPELVRQLQAELQRVGCNPGTVDGRWGDKGASALGQFARHAKLSIPTEAPTSAALEAVKGQQGRVCPVECGPGTVEKDGTCVAKAVPYREPSKAVKAAPAPKFMQRHPRPDKSKPGMCWAIDARSNTLVPCSDPRATTRAY